MKLERFKFGDIIENGWAGERNPHRIAMFIKHKKDTILMTSGADGKGEVWEQYHDKENRNKKIGSIFENPELLAGDAE